MKSTPWTIAVALATLVFLLPSNAEAQRTLVSNVGQSSIAGKAPDQNLNVAVAFETGGHTGGYILHSVVLDATVNSDRIGDANLVATLREREGSTPNPQASVLATLSNPSSLTTGLNTFTAPANTALSANTRYFIVLAESMSDRAFNWRGHSNNRLDVGSASGWSIVQGHRERLAGQWVSGSTSLSFKIHVRGNPAGVTNNPATGTPTISGTARVDQALTAGPGNITDADTGVPTTASGFNYRWQRETVTNSWRFIVGATSQMYTPVADDQDKKLRVLVSFSDANDYFEERTSAPTAAVQKRENAAPIGKPQIRGTPVVGQSLVAGTTDIMDRNGIGTFSYTWQRADNASGLNAEDAASASTSDTYVLTANDEGKFMRVIVSYTDDDDYNEVVAGDWLTAAVGPTGTALPVVTVSIDPPSVVGTNSRVVFTLTRTGNTSTALLVRVHAQSSGSVFTGSFRNPFNVVFSSGATVVEVRVQINTLDYGDDSVSGTLTVLEGNGYTIGTDSVATVTITAPQNTPATGEPSITGVARVNETLRAGRGTIRDVDSQPSDGDLRYQWERQEILDDNGSWTDLTGETNRDYVVNSADLGLRLRVEVSFRDHRSRETEMRTSTATDPVGEANNPASGTPVITGPARVGQTLTASKGDIDDPDGGVPAAIDDFTFTWDRLNANGVLEAENVGMDSSTYTLVAADEGKKIQVTLGFTDAIEIKEKRTSDPYPSGTDTVEAAASVPVATDPVVSVMDSGDVFNSGIAVFILSRTGDTSTPLTVNIRITGNGVATPKTSAETATFEATLRTVSVSVSTVLILPGQPAMTVELEVQPGQGYVVIGDGISHVATVSVREQPINIPATGSPTINGTTEVGQTLTVSTLDIRDANGLGATTFFYTWRRTRLGTTTPQTISDVVSPAYTLTAADEGHWIGVDSAFTDSAGYLEMRRSIIVGPVVEASASRTGTPATGEPMITGTPQVGRVLEAMIGNVDDSDGLPQTARGYSHSWIQANDSTGAGRALTTGTTAAYTPVASDVGKQLRVLISFTDRAGNLEIRSSGWTASVAAAVPGQQPNSLATGTPMIPSTTPQVGQTMTATTGDIYDANGLPQSMDDYSYQWYRADDDSGTGAAHITGATLATYTPVTADQGKHLRVTVSFTDGTGSSESRSSDWSDAVMAAAGGQQSNTEATGMPMIPSEAPQVGQAFEATTGDIDDEDGRPQSPEDYSYQWSSAEDASGTNAVAIATAVSASYTPVAADEGKHLQVTVSFTDGGSTKESRSSIWSDAVTRAQVVLSDAPQVGQTIMATTRDILDASGIPLTPEDFTYQWYRADDAVGTNAVLIATAVSAAYTPIAADEGRHLQVTVWFNDSGGTRQSRSSGWTDAVASASLEISIAAPPSPVVEPDPGGTTADLVITATLSGAAASDVIVTYSLSGTATEGVDYTVPTSTPSNTLTFTAGDTEALLTLSVLGDFVSEGTGETVIVTLDDSESASIALNNSAEGTITERPNQVEVSAAIDQAFEYSANDDETTVRFDVSLSAPAASTGAVDWRAVYTDSAGASAAGRSAGARATQIMTGTADFAATDTAVSELVIFDGELMPGGRVEVQLQPFMMTGGNATASAVKPSADLAEDSIETVTDSSEIWVVAALAEVPSGANPAAAMPEISIATPPSSVVEPAPGGTANDLVFTATLSSQATSDISVTYSISGTATEGVDYMAPSSTPSNTLTFTAGNTEALLTLSVLGDFVSEGTGETVIVTLGESTDADIAENHSAEGTITERPGQVEVSAAIVPTFEYSADTDATTVRFDVSLSAPAASAGAVAWRAVYKDSAGGRASQTPSGSVDFAFDDTTSDSSSAIFEGNLLSGGSVEIHLKPFDGATVSAVKPSDNLDEDDPETITETSTSEIWVVAAVAAVRYGATAKDWATTSALAAFGRSVATSLVETVWSRAEAHRHGIAVSYARLDGRSIDTTAIASNPGARQTVTETARLFGIEAVDPSLAAIAVTDDGSLIEGSFEDFKSWAGLSDSDVIADRSSFSLALEEGGGSSIVYWGAGSLSNYASVLEDDRFSNLESDGSTTTISLGIDYRRSNSMLLGLAVSSSSGSSEYKFADKGDGSGELSSSLTTFTPWFRWKSATGMEIWGAVGIGSGAADGMHGSEKVEMDLSAQIISAGAWNQVTTFGSSSIAAKADVFSATISSDGAGDEVDGTDAASSRVRVAAEMSPGGSGSIERSSSYALELGARVDSGEAESGFGVDAAAEFDFGGPRSSVKMTGRGGLVLFHGQEGFSETGFGLGITYDPGADALGLQLSLQPTWNASHSSPANAMWSADSGDFLSPSVSEGAAIETRLGYGMAAIGDHALATLYGSVHSERKESRMRLGGEMQLLRQSLDSFHLDLYGEAKEQNSVAESAVMLEGSLAF